MGTMGVDPHCPVYVYISISVIRPYPIPIIIAMLFLMLSLSIMSLVCVIRFLFSSALHLLYCSFVSFMLWSIGFPSLM